MAAEILGNDAANFLKDTAEAEVIRGLGGNDTLVNLANFDTLYGGDGGDTLRLSQPSKAYFHVVGYGDAGNDLLRMRPGCDVANLFGGAGADTIFGTGHGGYFTGATEADLIIGGPRSTWQTNRILAYGDAGNDTMTGIWDAYGGDNADLMKGCHIASAGNGRDTVGGTTLGDYLSDDGTDRQHNFFYGGGGNDQIIGGHGTDWIEGGSQNDVVWGRSGGDVLFGGAGRDQIFGGSGQDFLAGDDGRDSLSGGTSNDRLDGGDGGDTLSGDLGRDVLWGGTGADIFLFSALDETGRGASSDVICDFVPGEDRIKLAFGPLTFIGTDAFSKSHGEVRFDAPLHRLQIDMDGNGVTDAAIVLDGITDLTPHDLIL